MPKRSISDSCRTRESLSKISDGAERLYWRLWTVADDYGRFDTNPTVVRAFALPLVRAKVADVEKRLGEMATTGLIQLYVVDGRRYGQFNLADWEEANGKPRAKKSKFPAPTSENICVQMFANAPDPRSSISRSTIDESEPSVPATLFDSDKPARRAAIEFPDFWSFYPRKDARLDAEKAYAQVLEAGQLPALIELRRVVAWQVDRGCLKPVKARDGRDVRPLAGSYLRGLRFNDEEPRAEGGAPAYVEPNNRLLDPAEVD